MLACREMENLLALNTSASINMSTTLSFLPSSTSTKQLPSLRIWYIAGATLRTALTLPTRRNAGKALCNTASRKGLAVHSSLTCADGLSNESARGANCATNSANVDPSGSRYPNASKQKSTNSVLQISCFSSLASDRHTVDDAALLSFVRICKAKCAGTVLDPSTTCFKHSPMSFSVPLMYGL